MIPMDQDLSVTGPSETRQPRYPSGLIVVAHRGPVSISFDERGTIEKGPAAGGLAPSLARALSGTGATWLACATGEAEREVARGHIATALVEGVDVRYLDISEEWVHDAYQTIANETLWFLYHDMLEEANVHFDGGWRRAFAHFRAYNRAFAEAIVDRAVEGATIMVNDYHLPLVGPMLASKRPDLKTVHFSHTPFCTPERLEILPDDVIEELLTGMASYGSCGFHTKRWAEMFQDCMDHFGFAAPPTFSCPLGVDAKMLAIESSTDEVESQVAKNELRFAGRRVIFRSDRLEPTKNIVRGFEAFARLLELSPELLSQVVFYARAYLSRTDIARYREYRDEILHVVQEINNRFTTDDLAPVIFEVDNNYDASLAAYWNYDVLLVNPLLDGMNLIAKEAPVVNVRNGAVVLSTGAGAFEQLHDAVIGIDPFDVEATAHALETALYLTPEERLRRSTMLKAIASERAPGDWLAEVLTYARTARPGSRY